MAVLEKAPSSGHPGLLDGFLGLGSLTLTEGDHFDLAHHVRFLSELLEVRDWIRSSGQHENQRSDVRRVVVACLQVESWRVDEILADMLRDEILDCQSHFVGSDRLQHDHLLEGVQSVVPFAWKLLLVGIGGIEDLLELLVELNEIGVDSLEVLDGGHVVELLVNLSPLDVVEPVGRVGLVLNLSAGASKEESPFLHVDLVVSEEDFRTQQEREQELMGFEQGSTDVLVQRQGEVVVQDSDSGSYLRVWL